MVEDPLKLELEGRLASAKAMAGKYAERKVWNGLLETGAVKQEDIELALVVPFYEPLVIMAGLAERETGQRLTSFERERATFALVAKQLGLTAEEVETKYHATWTAYQSAFNQSVANMA